MSSSVSAPDFKEAVKADTKQAQHQFEDCMPCRLIGAGAFMGLGVYTHLSGQSQLARNKAEILKKGGMLSFKLRQGGIGATAVGLIALGAYRLFSD